MFLSNKITHYEAPTNSNNSMGRSTNLYNNNNNDNSERTNTLREKCQQGYGNHSTESGYKTGKKGSHKCSQIQTHSHLHKPNCYE